MKLLPFAPSVPIRLATALGPEECVERLTAAIDSGSALLPSSASIFGSRPVIGRVTTSSLRLRKRIGYRNSFQGLLTATLRRQDGGTLISGAVAIDLFVRIFMLIWMGGVFVIGGAGILTIAASIIAGQAPKEFWLSILVPPLMLAFGYGLVRFGCHLARDEAAFLKDFLIQTLDAREQSS